MLNRGLTSGRSDDTKEDVIRARLIEYNSKTSVVADYYRQFEKVVMVEGEGTVDEIFNLLCIAINIKQAA